MHIMIKRILFLFMMSLFLVSCEGVESTPTIETPVESTEPTNEPLPEPKEIDMINYTYYHHFITISDEIHDPSNALAILINQLGSYLAALEYVKTYTGYIDVNLDFWGNHMSKGVWTYYPIGELDDFIVYDLLRINITSGLPITHYVTQTHVFNSYHFRERLIFVQDGMMYHFNEMVEDMGYDTHVLAHIFNLGKYRIEPFEQVDLELPEGVAINYEHVFFLDGECYTLGQARVSSALGEAFVLDVLTDTQIMSEETLFYGIIDHPYYAHIYYESYAFLTPIPNLTTHYRVYVFDLEGYAYYYKTMPAFTPYYVLYNEIIYTIEDVLIQDLLTFEELNGLIGLQREALIID
jgi:hypothetical protein